MKKQPMVPSVQLCDRWVRVLRSPQTTTLYPDDMRALQLLADWLTQLRAMNDEEFAAVQRAELERAQREDRERAERAERAERERAEREAAERDKATAEEFARQERIAAEQAERERREQQ